MSLNGNKKMLVFLVLLVVAALSAVISQIPMTRRLFLSRWVPSKSSVDPAILLDWSLSASEANGSLSYLAEVHPNSLLHTVLYQAAESVLLGRSKDLVAYETVEALQSLPGGTLILADPRLQQAVSHILGMSFEDLNRVHVMVDAAKSSHHVKSYEWLASTPDCAVATLAVIVIPSLPSAFQRRDLIRNAWGKRLSEWRIRLLFVLGVTPGQNVDELEKEHRSHQDTLIANFTESYYNLTLKCLLAMKWVAEHCSAAGHMVKADDDVYVYPHRLHQLLRTLPSHERVIIGNVGRGFEPHRSLTSKWYVPFEVYAATAYPTFVFGPCYILPVGVLKDIIGTCQRLKYLHLEDVFITGVCVNEVTNKISHEQVPFFLINDCSTSAAIAVHLSNKPYVSC